MDNLIEALQIFKNILMITGEITQLIVSMTFF